MRLIKTYQSILRNLYAVTGVGFLLSTGAYLVTSEVLNLSQISASNAATVLGVVCLLSLIGGIVEFD